MLLIVFISFASNGKYHLCFVCGVVRRDRFNVFGIRPGIGIVSKFPNFCTKPICPDRILGACNRQNNHGRPHGNHVATRLFKLFTSFFF